MPDKVAFLPWTGIFALMQLGVDVPALRALVTSLRSHFDVELASPARIDTADKLHPRAIAPASLQEATRNVRGALHPGGHLVAMGWHGTEALFAARESELRSLVLMGYNPPMATLRAAGMSAVADAVAGYVKRRSSSYLLLRLFFEGLEDEDLRSLVGHLDAVTDWDAERTWFDWQHAIDFIKQHPELTCPVLYLHSPLDLPGVRKLVTQLLPRAEIGSLDSFPTRLQDADSGSEAAEKIIPFLQRHSA